MGANSIEVRKIRRPFLVRTSDLFLFTEDLAGQPSTHGEAEGAGADVAADAEGERAVLDVTAGEKLCHLGGPSLAGGGVRVAVGGADGDGPALGDVFLGQGLDGLEHFLLAFGHAADLGVGI